ncbi:uncharacterized protein LOC143461765 isoform X1 [Clavelina lepadiformis]|uniref:uncharacterized protein LOC143461765 isoform X1 n=1 Tax=Clavelina lepadiformis TaxID=159417 RepID=UPI004042948E
MLTQFFSQQDNFVYCKNIKGLLSSMGLLEYKPEEWRLFIDSSKKSLKCVLLRNGNKFACVPIGHSVVLKEHYQSVKMILKKLFYTEHNWEICVDLKMFNFLLGHQGGYTKYPWFICYWDNRATYQRWIKKEWPIREQLVHEKKNCK